MVGRCSCEGVASENRDLISEELLFLARFLADQSKMKGLRLKMFDKDSKVSEGFTSMAKHKAIPM